MTEGEIAILASTIIGSAGIIGLVITAWVKLSVKIADVSARVVQVEKDVAENKRDLEKHRTEKREDDRRVYDKLDEVLNAVNDVKLQLSNKADKS